MDDIRVRAQIDFVEKNQHGAWVINGEIGIRQYYYYSRKEALQRYREECLKKRPLVNRGPKSKG